MKISRHVMLCANCWLFVFPYEVVCVLFAFGKKLLASQQAQVVCVCCLSNSKLLVCCLRSVVVMLPKGAPPCIRFFLRSFIIVDVVAALRCCSIGRRTLLQVNSSLRLRHFVVAVLGVALSSRCNRVWTGNESDVCSGAKTFFYQRNVHANSTKTYAHIAYLHVRRRNLVK